MTDLTHAHMDSDEWIEEWVSGHGYHGGLNPAENETAVVPPLPKGAVVANIKGGVYWATAEEISAVFKAHGYGPTKIREALIERSGDDDETREFYTGATLFEHALILAWYDSSLNQNERRYL